MGINIKNTEAERLIRELAQATGEGQTAAVMRAVRERLERVNAEKNVGMAERILAIAREFHEYVGGGPAPDHDAMLYDPETGLPK